MTVPSGTGVVDDPRTLRALAHPLRLHLLGRLRAYGPATASELGRALGESSGSTSYHLRQLERFGFVEPVPDQPSRREKQWRAQHASTDFRLPAEGDATGYALLGAVTEAQLTALVEGVRRRSATAPQTPREWNEAHFASDVLLRVSAAQLCDLKEEVREVVDRYRASEDPQAQLVMLHLQSFTAEDAPDTAVPPAVTDVTDVTEAPGTDAS